MYFRHLNKYHLFKEGIRFSYNTVVSSVNVGQSRLDRNSVQKILRRRDRVYV